ncbi:uncharacterized protein Z518_09121 [Rhinocladiella mackenziei CBS 650.93]|uniref:Major facilitator superfamily (MFS) profile domain-containing protein n=1 Tax=Rhinocladiella mackenziei CBS 650.93 TaxID=1442369 RepID=A0A0D2IXU3_9EURO|nr:uncharacterized protein Z518_09121 [Rhinocladiella mackenziei CBS 650.93]KIX01395.1 hypothetical protein Z518_09121 [Rhinocladiella mackenziei CBS 650.93]
MSPPGKPFWGLKGTTLSWAISLCSARAFLLFGYDQGIMGSIISTPCFLEAINVKVGDHPDASNADTISTVVAIYDVGCMVGCLVAAIWGSLLGRKRTIAMEMIIMIAGAVLQTASLLCGSDGRWKSRLGYRQWDEYWSSTYLGLPNLGSRTSKSIGRYSIAHRGFRDSHRVPDELWFLPPHGTNCLAIPDWHPFSLPH